MVPTPRSTPLKNLLLAVGSTLVAFLAFEGAFRVHGHLENRGVLDETFDAGIAPPEEGPAELGHIIRPSPNRRIVYELEGGLDVTYSGARVVTDEEGFRSPSGARELERAGYRIVGIGDSFMFGLGVAGDEPYLAVLERRLRERHPELDARVLNMAVPGYNTVMEVAALEEKALAYRPHLVIVEFVGNDLRLPNFIRRKKPVLSLGRSFFVDFVKRRLERRGDLTVFQRLAEQGLEPGLGRDLDEVPAEYRDMVGWRAYVEAMGDLRRLSFEHGFEVLSITLQPPSPLQDKVMALSEELGFYALDVGAVFDRFLRQRGIEEYMGSPLARSTDDGHPTALGHRIAAGAIYRTLRAEYLLPAAPP